MRQVLVAQFLPSLVDFLAPTVFLSYSRMVAAWQILPVFPSFLVARKPFAGQRVKDILST
jgi:hypothetical protein